MRGDTFVSPVLSKEIRQRFRTFRGSLVVFLYIGAVAAITLGFIYLNNRSGMDMFQPSRSREIFIMLSMLQLVLIAFVAPGLSAGVISSERERQTLNILLTTRLSTASIILSKLISSLAFTLLLVIGTLPVYAVVTLYGGIAPNQLAGVFGLYFINMIFFGSVGVFLSTWIKRTGVSTVVAYGFIFALVIGTALSSEMLEQYYRSQAYLSMATVGEHGKGFLPYETPQIVWVLRSLNPVVVMASVFENISVTNLPVEPWKLFTYTYSGLSFILILASIYILKPVKRKIGGL